MNPIRLKNIAHHVIFTTCLIAVAIPLFLRCTPTKHEHTGVAIPYPAPLPDSAALTFLPGVVTGDSLDFNAAFSPDGKSFYFTRSIQRRYRVLVTTFDGQQWTAATPAAFNDETSSDADAAFAPDGSIYFISDRPRHAADTTRDFDIWFVKPLPGGKWSAPENAAAVNSDSTEYYVAFAANGNLYFASNRAGGLGDHDIFVSRLQNGAYTTPENLGAAINAPQMEHDPFVTPDEKVIFFTSVSRADSYGSADIYYSVKDTSGVWAPAKNMGPRVNTDSYEYCSYLSPDGRYYFFSSHYDVNWIDTRLLPVAVK